MLSTLRSAMDTLGAVNGLLYLAGRLLQRITGDRFRIIRYLIVAQPVPTPFTPSCRPSETETVAAAASGDGATAHFPRPPEVIRHRYEQGHTCLVATSKGRFAGFLWFARGHYEEDEVHCRFVLAAPDHCAWDYDVHVEPQFRMGRTFARLWDAANERYAAAGIRWSCSRISAFNRQSLQSHQRLGIRKLATLTFICLGPLQVSVMSCRPFFNVSWRGAGRPSVVVVVATEN